MRCALIVPRFNPCGYLRPRQNFHRFMDSLQRQVDLADVRVAEALYDGQVSDGWWDPLPATQRNFMWQKERLINYAIARLPADYDAVAWLDSDLLFQNPDWYAATCEKLHDCPVLQLFETVTYLGPDGRTPQRHGCGSAASADNRLRFRAPGGAIAVRRELLPPTGLYQFDVMGGGDTIFMAACTGNHRRSWIKRHSEWQPVVRAWCNSFGPHNVGFIPGNVRHLFHGYRSDRHYRERHVLLSTHRYDPQTDVRIGENGLLEWCSDKPDLHAAVREYFMSRNEDSVVQSA